MKFLHVGCGKQTKKSTTRGFNSSAWQETRFDIDNKVSPDIVGSMTDMSSISDESFDAIYSSHNIEHLYPHEVGLALTEFRRVLKDDGFIFITCPDLQSVCKLVAEDRLLEVAYNSAAGPISAVDMLYGHREEMKAGNLYMSHRSGFTQNALLGTVKHFGFKSFASLRRETHFDLFLLATKDERTEGELEELAALHFPPQT